MEPSAVGARLKDLATSPIAGASVRTGVEFLCALFSDENSPGTDLAAAALVGAIDEEEIRQLAPMFAAEMSVSYQIGAPNN